jgi:hypothetical protein
MWGTRKHHSSDTLSPGAVRVYSLPCYFFFHALAVHIPWRLQAAAPQLPSDAEALLHRPATCTHESHDPQDVTCASNL